MTRTARVPRWLRLAMAVVMFLQISGLTHVVFDAIHFIDHATAESGGCCDDSDCPPGCPNCHCDHPAQTLPPSPTRPALLVAAESTTVTLTQLVEVRSDAQRDAIFRPPRPSAL